MSGAIKRRAAALVSKLVYHDDSTASTARDDVDVDASAAARLSKRARTLLANTAAKRDANTLSTCRPWRKEDFVKRVVSFTVSRWFAKPSQLNPLHCARTLRAHRFVFSLSLSAHVCLMGKDLVGNV